MGSVALCKGFECPFGVFHFPTLNGGNRDSLEEDHHHSTFMGDARPRIEDAGETRHIHDEEDDDILFFEEDDIREGIEVCSKSLLGRLLADRAFSIGTMEAALGAIWGHPEGFRVVDHGDNTFQFFFERERDVLRVELGAPWLFKNFILNLKRWKDDKKIDEEDFSRVPIWI